jgi:hypothetical protein
MNVAFIQTLKTSSKQVSLKIKITTVVAFMQAVQFQAPERSLTQEGDL